MGGISPYMSVTWPSPVGIGLKKVMQSKQQALWAYCPNIYTVISARLVLFGHDFSLNESSLSSAASVSPIPPLPTGLVIGRVPRGPRRPRPHSVAISASSSSSCGQLQHSPIRRKLQREKPREFFRVAAKIQQTKMLVTCQRFGDLFLFWLVWQYSSVQTKYNKGMFKVMATYLQQ